MSIEITPGMMPSATTLVPWSVNMDASGGTAPYTFSVTAGSLPAGLSLDTNTGIISGAPTTPGDNTFVITATDASGAVGSAIFGLNVANMTNIAATVYATIDTSLISNLASSVLFRTRKPSVYGAADNPNDNNLDPMRNVQEISDAIKVIDAVVAGTIRSTVGHRLRRLFFEQVAFADGDEITSLPLGGILIDDEPGVEVTPDVLRRLKRNTLQLTTNEGYYSWNKENRGIFNFTGSAAVGDVIKDIGSIFPATPKECAGTVFFGVMAAVLPKEGKFIEAQSNYANLYNRGLELIKLGGEGEKLPQLEIRGFGG